MFVLNDIETLPDDLDNLPEKASHRLTFRVVFTIKGVPDTFTGLVFEAENGELVLQHFNNPRGNVRKIITLKNKLADGAFAGIRDLLFAVSRGEAVSYPQEFETAVVKSRRPGR